MVEEEAVDAASSTIATGCVSRAGQMFVFVVRTYYLCTARPGLHHVQLTHPMHELRSIGTL